jgi:hypothetical protein
MVRTMAGRPIERTAWRAALYVCFVAVCRQQVAGCWRVPYPQLVTRIYSMLKTCTTQRSKDGEQATLNRALINKNRVLGWISLQLLLKCLWVIKEDTLEIRHFSNFLTFTFQPVLPKNWTVFVPSRSQPCPPFSIFHVATPGFAQERGMSDAPSYGHQDQQVNGLDVMLYYWDECGSWVASRGCDPLLTHYFSWLTHYFYPWLMTNFIDSTERNSPLCQPPRFP